MKPRHWLWGLLLAGAALRLIGIGYGLPAVFNADEPHIVNVAVSFGAGTLNPHHFKYPTLYLYSLFAAYGTFFLFWSGFGLAHSVRQFGELFVWHPSAFYLIARLLSAGFSLASLVPVFRAGRLLYGERGGVPAAAFLAAAPVLIESSHAAKPESLMLLLSAWAWFFAARHHVEGRRRDLALCGLLTGLAASTQYTAAPLVVLVPVAWSLGRGGSRALTAAAAAAAAGFLAGSPFILLDLPAFLRGVQDMRTVPGMVGGALGATWVKVLWNLLTFSGPWFIGGAALLAGLARFGAKDRSRLALFAAPVAFLAACLSFSAEGAWQRYLFAVFPGLALAAAAGVDWALSIAKAREASLAAALAAVVLPGAWASLSFDRRLLLPDTRTLSADWIRGHVPAGSKILLDQEHASPSLRMSRETVERLLRRTRAAGHPRARVYELMASSHPGGGYAIYRVRRSAKDLHTLAGEAEFSSQGQAFLDVHRGLDAARAEGIAFVALTSFGAEPERSPELAGFLEEVRRKGRLLAEFEPKEGERAGPEIRIYAVR